MTWEGLSPPYATIVADPPWAYEEGWPCEGSKPGSGKRFKTGPRIKPFSFMSLQEISELPIADLAERDAHLYLWTTNRFLRDAFAVVTAWGFNYSATLVWCKEPMGLGPGGAFASTTEFVLFARRGSLKPLQRHDSTWFRGKRSDHSVKPASLGDLVEKVSPGPYVELFARQPRLGWDAWGYGYETPRPPDMGVE